MQSTRRTVGAIVAALLLSAGAAFAQYSRSIFESVTVAGTAVGLSAATYTPVSGSNNVVVCTMRLETAQIRFRYDGTNPTSSEGMVMEVGDVFTLRGYSLIAQFKAIRTGSTSGVLKVSCDS